MRLGSSRRPGTRITRHLAGASEDGAVIGLPAVDCLAAENELGQLRVDEEYRRLPVLHDLVASLHAVRT